MSEHRPTATTAPARVRWAELLPDEFRTRRADRPLAWLPLGLCEPHGHIAAFGLDTIKADWLCDEGARRYGGIVAPTQGWHIHETGYHARWLEEVVGENPAEIGDLPPDVVLRGFLYQLRAFANAGFRSVLALSGHAGGNQHDLRRVAAAFARVVPLTIEVYADPELVSFQYSGDHAGQFEISQLLALRPELVDLSRLTRGSEPGAGGRFALGDDAAAASAQHGRAILAAQLDFLGAVVHRLSSSFTEAAVPRVSMRDTEAIWKTVVSDPTPFVTAQPLPGQAAVSAKSQWKADEFYPLRQT